MSGSPAATADTSARPPDCAEPARRPGLPTGAAVCVVVPAAVTGRPRHTEYFPPSSRPAARTTGSADPAKDPRAASHEYAITAGAVDAAGCGTSCDELPGSRSSPAERHDGTPRVGRDKRSPRGCVVERMCDDKSVPGQSERQPTHGDAVADRDQHGGVESVAGRRDELVSYGAGAGRDRDIGFLAGHRDELVAYGAVADRDSGSAPWRSNRHRVRARGGVDDRSRTERVRTTQENARAAHNRQGYRVRRRRTA